MMEFSSPILSGTLPSPRSWHASAVLPQQRIFIHGGYDGEQILTDSFVLELGEFKFFFCIGVLVGNTQISQIKYFGISCMILS